MSDSRDSASDFSCCRTSSERSWRSRSSWSAISRRRLRIDHCRFRRGLFFLREDDASFVQRSLRRRELLAQLFMPPRFSRLSLQRIQIARDLGERVVDAEKILLRLFELQFRGAALVL